LDASASFERFDHCHRPPVTRIGKSMSQLTGEHDDLFAMVGFMRIRYVRMWPNWIDVISTS
jgi:hypothetical protein